MRLHWFLGPVIALIFSACGQSPRAEAPSEAVREPVPVAKAAATNEAPDAGTPRVAPVRPGPYRLLGVLDPDRGRMVAFALKVPGDWRVHQEFYRKWEGAVGLPQIGLSLNAPDGRAQIVYFPLTQYLYSEGPMTSNLRAQKASLGMPTQSSPTELPPMSPVDYLRKVFLPNLAQNGVTLRDLGNEQTAPSTRDENGQAQSRGSIDGILPNGNRARLECRITHASRQLGSDLYHTWSAVPSITQTATNNLEAIHVHTRMAQDSFVVNPAWLRIEQETQARGMQANQDASRRQHEATMDQLRANTEAMNRGHEQRMAAIRQFGEANTARFNQRMADLDHDQRIRVDTLRGETRYADPTTGERVKVEDGANHVYRNQQNPNFYYATDTPIDVGKVDWQELQKVQLQDY